MCSSYSRGPVPFLTTANRTLVILIPIYFTINISPGCIGVEQVSCRLSQGDLLTCRLTCYWGFSGVPGLLGSRSSCLHATDLAGVMCEYNGILNEKSAVKHKETCSTWEMASHSNMVLALQQCCVSVPGSVAPHPLWFRDICHGPPTSLRHGPLSWPPPCVMALHLVSWPPPCVMAPHLV